MWFRNLKFRKKILVAFVIISIIPMIILGSYSYVQTMQLIKESSIRNLDNYAKETADVINEKFTRYKSIMSSVVFNTNLKNLLDKDVSNDVQNKNDLMLFIEPLFNATLKSNNDMFNMIIYNKGNDVRYGNMIVGFDKIKDEPWVDEVINTKNIKWFYTNEKLFAACAISDYYGDNNLGLVFMELNSNLIFKEILYNAKENYGICVKTDDNIIVVNRPIEDNNGKTVFFSQSAKIKTSDWQVDMSITKKEFFRDGNGILKLTLVILILTFIILILIVIFVSNVLVKRIGELCKNIKSVATSEKEIVFASDYTDEIGELTNSIGNMLHEKQKLATQLYKEKINQKEAELKSLQAQINPHFLYNVLSIINCMALQKDEYEISRITNIISKFYRNTLSNGNDILNVREELENVNTYLEIMLIKRYDVLKVVKHFDDEIYNYKMIKLLLQPVVENAIEHGVLQLINKPGVVTITGSLADGYLWFSVMDNGIGMDKQTADSMLSKESKGYGIKNVNERIKLYYGDDCGVLVESKPNEGTKITLKLRPIGGDYEKNNSSFQDSF